jgi:plasmid stabilization system protein ParE
MNVNFLNSAETELEEGVEYYNAQKSGLGFEFLDQVQSAVARIKQYPDAWQQLSRRTRRCLIKQFPYGIIYQIRVNEILIVAIIHLHRKPDYWVNRL